MSEDPQAAQQAHATFTSFGRTFQEKVVQSMLLDPKWAEQMAEVMDSSYFDLKYLQFVVDRHMAYARRYKSFPTVPILITILRDDLKGTADQTLRGQIVDYLRRMQADPELGDLPFVKEKSLEFCRKQALRAALESAVDDIEGNRYEAIVDRLKKAVAVGTPTSPGLDLVTDVDARYAVTARMPVPTGHAQLDAKGLLSGGLGRGELGVIVAPTGVGKCTKENTLIHVRYRSIKNDGIESSETWTHETITIGGLFRRFGFDSDARPTDDDDDGDSVVDARSWDIEVESTHGFFPVQGARWTKPERTVRLVYSWYDRDNAGAAEDALVCSPEHLVLRIDPQGGKDWTRVGDLATGDRLIGDGSGTRTVISVESLARVERLCDIQVGEAGSYLTNGILSHNSHELVDLGAHAVSLGINVAQFTFELSEAQILKRYDSRLIDVDFDDLDENRARVDEFYADMRPKLGTLRVKYYPSGTATVFTLRAWLERQALSGFVPGLILIDYADIMRSSRQYEQLRMELKLIYEELRALAGEMTLPIWTASQSNKEGSSSEVVDLTNMSEAYGKAMVADVVLGLSRRPQEKALGLGRLYVAKNRAGRDGIVYPIKINTARSKITITGGPGTLEEVKAEDEGTMKSRLAGLRRTMSEKVDLLRGDGIHVGEQLRSM
jgi:replicative DNA helicase